MVPFYRYSISELSSFAIYHLTYGFLHVFASQEEFSFSDSMAFRLKWYDVDANTFVSRWAPFNFTRAEDAHTHTHKRDEKVEAKKKKTKRVVRISFAHSLTATGTVWKS